MAGLKQYAGSIALSGDGREFVVTGPKGNHALFFDRETGAPKAAFSLPQASGATRFGSGLAITIKGGLMVGSSEELAPLVVRGDLIWDNHLVPV